MRRFPYRSLGRAAVWAPALGVILALGLAAAVWAGAIKVGDFSAGDLSGWESKEFKGSTQYRLVEMDGRKVLEADSAGTASGLFKEMDLEPKTAPVLRWSWKIEGVLPKGDARVKEGDDYAARVYVVFPSLLFWRTRGINYIWANKLPQGDIVPNPFAGTNVMMVAVESGEAKAGQWVSEERNILEDYRACFGEDATTIGAIAVMTDSDNTGGKAKAWYGDITLSGK